MDMREEHAMVWGRGCYLGSGRTSVGQELGQVTMFLSPADPQMDLLKYYSVSLTDSYYLSSHETDV